MTAAVNKRVSALVLGAVIFALIFFAVMFLWYKHTDSIEVIVLMYHHVSNVGDDSVTVSQKKLEADFSYIAASGYNTVSVGDLISFVDGKSSLPERVLCVVFDDGYESNYTLAFPLLQKYGIKAAVSVIGSSVGKCIGALPHFNWQNAADMEASGLVTVISHTYDMHMDYENGIQPYRPTAVPLIGENPKEFASVFRADYKQMTALMRSHLGHAPTAFAYPHGVWSETSEAVLSELEVQVTFISEAGMNTVVRGDPETLRLMKRYNINETVDIAEILG